MGSSQGRSQAHKPFPVAVRGLRRPSLTKCDQANLIGRSLYLRSRQTLPANDRHRPSHNRQAHGDRPGSGQRYGYAR